MYRYNTERDTAFIQGSSVTYRKAVRLMKEAWERSTPESFDVVNASPRDTFKQALELFETKLIKTDSEPNANLHEALQESTEGEPEAKDLIETALETAPCEREELLDRDMDLVPPRLCLEITQNVALEMASEGGVAIIGFHDYLLEVMKALAVEMGWNPPLRVGYNRHFPRIWQWFCELSDNSWDGEDCGIRAMNTSGPVAGWPDGPGDLRVRINVELL